MYIKFDDKNVVSEIIPDINPAFPSTPIESRYPREFVDTLVHFDDSENVKEGMEYDKESHTFSYPEILSSEPIPENLDEAKVQKITESKLKLAQWLSDNPMTYTDGKKYTVTEEKQSLLNSNLASYERATQAGIPYPLKWNATGEECIEWEYPALVGLSLAMAGYVAPKVSKQQEIEIEINDCETIEQVEAVVIDYA